MRGAGRHHVVFLPSISAQFPVGAGPISGLCPVKLGMRAVAAEAGVAIPLLRAVAAEAGVAVTLLRAVEFLENLGNALGGPSHGVLANFVHVDAPIGMIATGDCGLTAAAPPAQGGQGVQR